MGGCGDREGRELCDICEGERDEGKDESDARGFLAGSECPLASDELKFLCAEYGVALCIASILGRQSPSARQTASTRSSDLRRSWKAHND